MESKPMHILVSAYACGPNWGSEIGMGWNWVMSISNYCKLTVITELGFKKDIEEVISELDIKFVPDFHYIDIGERGRMLFWKQGSASFYTHYKRWQKKALDLAKELISKEQFDIVHQLNMIGYREPGYLWKLDDIPYVIGPVGGYNQFPISYFSVLDFRNKLFYLTRNIINRIQMIFSSRPKKAYKRADYVILASPTGKENVSRHARTNPIIIPETGAHKLPIDYNIKVTDNEKLVLVWVGFITGRKALPIALKTIAKSKYKDNLILNIVGDGPSANLYKTMAEQLGLDNVNWLGSVTHKEAKKLIEASDMLFFTSVLEATSTVVFEALQANTPVLCHDTCGFGNVIDDSCGIKIPLENVSNSIEMFSEKIDQLIENPEQLKDLKKGCSERIKDYYWDEKGKKTYDIYKKCLE
ncbi:glycosyltransferase family 4 protein [Aquimarina pacifica]|uniref:glycosyltransferase family 4 protein n=1 Tax=Aquimarina pacifica TaxID=1296415 RepID=UPI0004BA4296|nr:glycosyltransferase [Aquimarina pacifica]